MEQRPDNDAEENGGGEGLFLHLLETQSQIDKLQNQLASIWSNDNNCDTSSTTSKEKFKSWWISLSARRRSEILSQNCSPVIKDRLLPDEDEDSRMLLMMLLTPELSFEFLDTENGESLFKLFDRFAGGGREISDKGTGDGGGGGSGSDGAANKVGADVSKEDYEFMRELFQQGMVASLVPRGIFRHDEPKQKLMSNQQQKKNISLTNSQQPQNLDNNPEPVRSTMMRKLKPISVRSCSSSTRRVISEEAEKRAQINECAESGRRFPDDNSSDEDEDELEQEVLDEEFNSETNLVDEEKNVDDVNIVPEEQEKNKEEECSWFVDANGELHQLSEYAKEEQLYIKLKMRRGLLKDPKVLWALNERRIVILTALNNLVRRHMLEKSDTQTTGDVAAANVQAQRVCAVCGQAGVEHRCGRCKIVWYCSEGCQRKDWPKHKTFCPS